MEDSVIHGIKKFEKRTGAFVWVETVGSRIDVEVTRGSSKWTESFYDQDAIQAWLDGIDMTLREEECSIETARRYAPELVQGLDDAAGPLWLVEQQDESWHLLCNGHDLGEAPRALIENI